MTDDTDWLDLDPTGGWLQRAEGSVSDLETRGYELARSQPIPVRLLRGGRMRSKEAACAEIAAALQLPHFAGGGWDSLHDSLGDLSWLGQCGAVLVITAAGEVLADQPHELVKLLHVLVDARSSWRHPDAPADPHEEPGPFTVVLHDAHDGDVLRRWWALL